MADTIELVGGWIVAGLVTLAGVLVAQWVAEHGRRRQEDRVTIYEPVHRELEAVLQRGPRPLKSGYSVWAPSSEFKDLLNRGALIPKRRDPLRQDLLLVRLEERHESTWTAMYTARLKAIQEKWEATELVDEKGNRRKLADLLGHNFNDDQFNQAVTALDKDWWTRELDGRVAGQGGNLGFKFTLVTSAEDLFDQITKTLEATREEFMRDGETLLAYIERVKANLEKALADGRAYRGLEVVVAK